MKVLVIDDNEKLNKTITSFLELKKFNVTSATNGKEALKFIEKKEFDLYIVDIHLPKINGLELVKTIRTKNPNTPIIMITSSNEVDNFVNAFKNGCNEFIKKPFYLEELEIRLNNLLKQITTIKTINENISFDFKNQDLIINNEIIKIRKKEKLFLNLLIKHINDIVPTKEIIEYVWENEKKDNYPLRQLVSGLKQKHPILKKHIESITRVGYRFKE